MENLRFRSIFLDCYYLMNKKEYTTDVEQRPVAVATVTFQDGGYFGFKGI